MTEKATKGARRVGSQASPANAITFLVERMLAGGINTITLVSVVEVGDTLSVLPLVPQIDGFGATLETVPIHGVPFARLQGGIGGVICDPVVGDIGIAVFCQRDISAVKAAKGPAAPGSRRTFDQADAVYLGGILNKTPTVYMELTQEGKMRLVAPGGLEVVAPASTFSGTVAIQGAITGGATITTIGDGVFNTHSATKHNHTSNVPGAPTSSANG